MPADDLSRKFFEILVRQNHRSLLAYARLLTSGDRTEAEELVQDSLVIAYEKIPEFDQSRDFGAWVRGIIRNRHRQLCDKRRRQATPVIAIGSLEIAVDPEEAEELFVGLDGHIGSRVGVLAALERCLDGLTSRLSEVLRLFYFRNHPIEAIAQQLACSEAAARKRLSRGRQLLYACVQKRLEAADG